MIIYDVLDTIGIGDNTSVLVDGKSTLFRSGVNVLDESGNVYEILSVGMPASSICHAADLLGKTSLLVKGIFSSDKLYAQ